MTTLYKIVGMAGEAIHGGSGTWFLPIGKRPGRWMPPVANVLACRRGYHLTPAAGIAAWLPPPRKAARLFEAEGRGRQSNGGEKIAFTQARLIRLVGVLDEVSMRLAVADIAELVLPNFELSRPRDTRPREAIKAARDFALGKIGDAARVAAGDAARVAAGDAARAARVAARVAAGAAAWDAAGVAARNAAGAAAGAAAWAAVGNAAWAAARAAHSKIIINRATERLAALKEK